MAQPVLALAPDWPGLLADACAGVGVTAVYQPIVDLQRGAIAGYEGLVRFTPDLGIGPERWFAAARALDCEGELEAAALDKVLAAREHLPPHTFLSVNVSPTALASDAVTQVLADVPDLRGLIIELTEHTRVDSYAELGPHLAAHRERGALVAIDDTGSGYAGLAHILELRPAILKLDRVLISGVDRDEAKRVLVEMLGLYAGHLDGWILAEGVETLAELETLCSLGVPLGQGWALGRPGNPWAEVPAHAGAVLQAASAQTGDTSCGVRPLLERARVATIEDRAAVSAALEGEPADTYLVFVDQAGAPMGACTPADSRSGQLRPVLRVSATTPVADVARRALTRPYEQRFDPVVCTDPAGRILGIVRMERITELLARLASRNDPAGDVC
jgi:EAL domain-containing protein (putative c-di-GMP-specific phosphodiesterase class I)